MSAAQPARRTAVCLVRHNYYPNGHLHRNARALAATGYDVSVVALRRPGEPAHEIDEGVTVYRLPLAHKRAGMARYVGEYLAFLVMALGKVGWLHRAKHFRIVQVDNMPDVLVFAALLPKVTGARIILYIADNMPEQLAEDRGLPAHHPLVRALGGLQRASADFADQVLVPNLATGRVVQARGVSGDKITPILNCPDDSVFSRLSPRSWDPHEGRLRIVTHGTLMQRYGIQVLIDALPRIAQQIPHVSVDIYGDGEYRAALEERVRHNGVADRVQFRGMVPQTAIPSFLDQADVAYTGLLSDRFLANKTLEYVALGLPLAISRWPAHEEYLPDNCVMYFRPGDAEDLTRAIVALHRDPQDARARAERAGQLFDRKYAWPIQREQYLRLYQADDVVERVVQPAKVA